MISCFSAFRANMKRGRKDGEFPDVLLVMAVVVGCCVRITRILLDGLPDFPYSDDSVLQELRVGSLKMESSMSCTVLQVLHLEMVVMRMVAPRVLQLRRSMQDQRQGAFRASIRFGRRRRSVEVIMEEEMVRW